MPRARNPLTVHVRAIRKALTVIDRSLTAMVALTKHQDSRAAPPKRKLKLSRKRRADLKLQGVYMTHMRLLKPRQKAQVKAVREKKGLRAAIAAATRLARNC